MFPSIQPQRYFWGLLLTDILAGVASVFVISLAALAIGGFSFFQPWLIVTPVGMFMAGFVRGPSLGNAWGKALALNAPIVLLMLVSFSSTSAVHTYAIVVLTAAATVLCSAAGISFRRREVFDSRKAASATQRRLMHWLWLTASVGAAAWTLFWLFCFLNGLIHGFIGVRWSIAMLLLAGAGIPLGRRAFAAFHETKESTATS